MSVDEIKDEAFKLSAEDRERLAYQLLDSVGEPEDPELIAELERRWQEIVTGKAKTVSAEEVFRNLETRLAEKRAHRQVS
jgi:putative addiction module component (TIGR02574 family)